MRRPGGTTVPTPRSWRSLETLERLFGDLGVDLTYVRRRPLALPHTKPGVYRAIAEFTEGLDPDARIQFAGDWLSQTGQNTAVRGVNAPPAAWSPAPGPDPVTPPTL